MTGSHRAERRPKRGGARKLVRHRPQHTKLKACLALGLVAVIGTTGSWAAWTDEVVVSGVTVSSATLDLKVNNADSLAGFTGVDGSNLVPGNSVAATFTVRNAGTAGLKYTVASAGSPAALTDHLKVKITSGAVSGTGLAKTCAGTVLAGPATIGAGLLTTGRALAAAASEVICLEIALDSSAPNSAQATTSALSITFSATT